MKIISQYGRIEGDLNQLIVKLCQKLTDKYYIVSIESRNLITFGKRDAVCLALFPLVATYGIIIVMICKNLLKFGPIVMIYKI